MLGNFANLLTLSIGGNRLSGGIPPAIGNLANLQTLNLEDNRLSGEIPLELDGLTNLASLRLAKNSFSGCAPQTLKRGPHLQYSGPVFCGDVDNPMLVTLYDATDGANWDNHSNWLSDLPIGEWYGVTTDHRGSVTELSLRENGLSGEIPPDLGNISHLRILRLHGNRLSGEIPSELGNLSNLEVLQLHDNLLTGDMPAELGSLSNLEELDLENNQLSGVIPSQLGSLYGLVSMFPLLVVGLQGTE